MIVIFTDFYGQPCAVNPTLVTSARPARREGLVYINFTGNHHSVCVRGTVEEVRKHLNTGLLLVREK